MGKSTNSLSEAPDYTDTLEGNSINRFLGNPLLKSTIIYTIGDSISKAIPFFLLPIVASYLSTSDYGILTNFGVISQILIAFCALNSYTLLTVSYYKLDNNGLSSFLSNSIYLSIFLAAVYLIVSLLFSGAIYKYSGISSLWQILAILTAFSTTFISLYTALLRMQNRVYLFNGFQIFQSVISVVLAIQFVVIFQWNWQGRVLSIVIAAAASMILGIWLLIRSRLIFRRLDINEMKNAFFFGLPLLPHTLSFWLKGGMDKIIITNLVGLSANGVYSVAITLGLIVGVFTGSFFNAYSPSLFKDLSTIDASQENDANTIKKKLVKITYLFAGALLMICVISYLGMRFIIPLLFKGDYLAAARFLPLIMTTVFFDGMYAIVSGYIFYRRKTKVLGTITFLSALLQILLTLIFVSNFGAMGAAYSSSIVSLITFLVVLRYANNLYKLPWALK